MPVPAEYLGFFEKYSSASQKARVITESWVKQNGYCLACESDRLIPTPANTQARDFECKRCGHPYEVKSAASPFGRRIVDGAYASMMRRIHTSTTPSFLLLQYTQTWSIANMLAVHHALITPSVIEQRKPLSITARRAGWIGCNILLTGIPPEGRIPLIVDGLAIDKGTCRSRFAATERLSHLSLLSRGWAATLLSMLHRIGKQEFTLNDAYSLEPELAALYPLNHNIRPKIRQQLQVLRDAGLITFEFRGHYRFAIQK